MSIFGTERKPKKSLSSLAVAGILFILIFPPVYFVITNSNSSIYEKAQWIGLLLSGEAIGLICFFFDMWIIEKLLIGAFVLKGLFSNTRPPANHKGESN